MKRIIEGGMRNWRGASMLAAFAALTAVVSNTEVRAALARADFNDLAGSTNAPQTGEGGGIGWADVWGAEPSQQSGAIKLGTGDLVAPAATNFNVPQLQAGDAGYTTSQLVYGDSVQERGNTRELTAAMSGEIWFSYLIFQRPGVGIGGLFFPSQHSFEPNSKPRAQVDGQGNLTVSINGADANSFPGVYTPNTTALIVGRITVGAGGAGSAIDAWVNPNLGLGLAGMGPPQASATGQLADSFQLGGFSSVGHVGVLGWNHAGGTFLDHLSISDRASAFHDVTGQAIPEPGALAIAGWTLIGFGAAVRQRRATSLNANFAH